MAEIQKSKRADVEKFLCDWFVKETAENVEKRLPDTADIKPQELPNGWSSGTRIHRDRARDYAEIAEFLSIQEYWQPSVATISELLHEHYIASLLMGRTNALASAISLIAPLLGFPQSHLSLSLAGFTDRNVFQSYVKRGAFWKDAVSSNHGEHSHSIQWLALAKAHLDGKLKIRTSIFALYKESVDYACTRTLYHADSRKYRVLLLWDWLVDCFDHGDNEADFATNITSETARSPTHLNKYLFEQGSIPDGALWIGQYLTGRHQKRGWRLPSEGRTGLREHAIARAGARGHVQIAANSGGNFVYTVDTMRVAADRLSKARGVGGTEVKATMVKRWNPIPSFSYRTSLNIAVSLNSVHVPEEFKSLSGTHEVIVRIEDNVGGCKATVVRTA